MARSWTEFLGDAEGPYETQEAQRSFVGRLRESLSKSRRALTEQIAVAAFDPGDDLAWERLEEALIQADVGVPATAELVQRLEARGELGDLHAARGRGFRRLRAWRRPGRCGVRRDRSGAGAWARRRHRRHRGAPAYADKPDGRA